jgi:hypothetical protein
LLRVLLQARRIRDTRRHYGQHLIDSSNAHLAWRYVRHAFMAATYG